MSNFEYVKKNANPNCRKCSGTGIYKYDSNHFTVCNLCCKHDKGYFLLKEYYGKDNGMYCCKAGCGHLITPEQHHYLLDKTF
jgi:hypothetical protein